jgi:predicted ATPase
VGCSAITLRKLEAEERRPSKQIAERLADVLNVAPDDRPAFLRFARGDPFAAPATPKTPDQPDQKTRPRHNLPHELTSFIGREKEIAEVTRLLSQPAGARLLTLTGAGGTGKTRLALQVAADQLDHFPHGVWLIELAPLADPALVLQTVASALGLREAAGRPLEAALLDHLRPKHLLLVLDNCEHLIQACADLAEALLRACPWLTILATSREGLGIAGESAYHVRPLSLPDPGQLESIETAARSEAVRLFVERAAGVLASFTLTNDNAPAVAQVCRQLDGIPLAIELVAARVGVLRVEQIVARLTARFNLLTAGSRTSLPRHQTLAALIDWSYDLLPAPERALFSRLAVFAGGWTLDAAEAVGAGEGVAAHDVLDLLMQLANKSLVVIERKLGAEARYRVLETIRQYALVKLVANGEADTVQRRHAEYYLRLSEASAMSASAFRRFEPESDNVRAALAWSLSAADGAELALRLALGAARVESGWNLREAPGYLEGALANADARGVGATRARADVLWRLGWVLAGLGDHAAGQVRMADGLRIFQQLGDRRASARVLIRLGWVARERGDGAAARRPLEEGVAIFRELGDKPGIADGLVTLGEVAVMQEDVGWATSLLEEGLALWQEQESRDGIGWALNHLGHVAQIQGKYQQATALLEESLSMFRQLGERNDGVAEALQSLGETALAQGKAVLATKHQTKALALFRDIGDPSRMAWCLAGLAGAAAVNEEPERAAWLWGAAEALRQSIGAREAPASHATRERLMATAREQLGETDFAAAWAEGQTMTPEQAIELALRTA